MKNFRTKTSIYYRSQITRRTNDSAEWERLGTRGTAKTGSLTSTIEPQISYGNDKSWKRQSDTNRNQKSTKNGIKDQKVQSYLSNKPDYKQSKKKFGHLPKEKKTQYAIPWKRDNKNVQVLLYKKYTSMLH